MIWPLPIEVRSRPSTIGSRYTPEIVGETACTTCRNNGREDSAPNIAKPAASPIAAETEKTEFLNSRSGRTGSAGRRAEKYQATSISTERATSPMMTGEDHAYVVPPHEVASTTAVANAASVVAPR